MSRVLIWDLPTRIFHWLLAGMLFAAAGIALLLGEHSPLFPYHAILGLTLALVVCLRIVWGLVGTRYARLGSFAFGPGAVITYFKSALLGGGSRHVGHNPGSAYAAFAMFALVAGLAVTGVMMGLGNERVEEIHEVLSYLLVGVVILHLLGVVHHTMRRHENITASMILGTKEADPTAAIRSSHPVVAVVGLLIVAAWTAALIRNFDSATQTTTLPLVGTSIQVGEFEDRGDKHRRGGEEHRHRDGDDHDDDDD